MATFAQPATAVTVTAVGYITKVYASTTTNYPFRVTVTDSSGVNQLAACNNGFAYAPTTDVNYEAKVTTALNLYALQKPAQVLADQPTTGGDCTIIEIGSP